MNYGNTDLPFTSHQTDNWPVSCCYDRGGGGGGGQRHVYMFWCGRIANRTRFISDAFDVWTRVKNVSVMKLFTFISPPAPASVLQNAVKAKYITSLFSNRMSRQYYLWDFFFFLFFEKEEEEKRKRKNLHVPHLCLHFEFAYQRNPIGTCFAYLHLLSNFKWTCQKW